MNYTELLKSASEKFNSIVCMGLDPVVEDIPVEGRNGEKIYTFYESILNKIKQTGTYPAAVKPNYAFYAQYGIDGIDALVKVIGIYKDEGIPVILDSKRCDIGKTARAYASEAFDFFGADAVTLSPYMGFDSISPFTGNYPDKGCYILTKTSNRSSGEIQDIQYMDAPLYIYIANKIVEWYSQGIASVVGATYPDQLSSISEVFLDSGYEVPLLIPGIGSQGGELKSVIDVLKKYKDYRIHRINSSSGINYAYKRYENLQYPDASVKAIRELNNEIEDLIQNIS